MKIKQNIYQHCLANFRWTISKRSIRSSTFSGSSTICLDTGDIIIVLIPTERLGKCIFHMQVKIVIMVTNKVLKIKSDLFVTDSCADIHVYRILRTNLDMVYSWQEMKCHFIWTKWPLIIIYVFNIEIYGALNAWFYFYNVLLRENLRHRTLAEFMNKLTKLTGILLILMTVQFTCSYGW